MSAKNRLSTEFFVFLLICIALIATFSFTLFGITGLRILAGIIFMSLPFYFILDNLKLTEDEKFVFSVLFGLTLFPSFVYLLGLLISFRIAIIASFLIFAVAAFLTKMHKPKKQEH